MDEFQIKLLEVLGRIADELNELVNTHQKLGYNMFGHDSLDPYVSSASSGVFGDLVKSVDHVSENMPVLG